MNISEENFINEIDRYLDGNMSTQEMLEFKEMLKEHPDKHDLLEKHVIARAQIRNAGEHEQKQIFLEKLAANDLQNKPSISSSSNSNKKLIYFVGLFLILSSLVFFLFKNFDSTSSSKQQSVPIASIEDPSYELFRSTDADSVSSLLWNKAIVSFSQKEYSKAIAFIEDLANDPQHMQKNTGKVLLMQGVSYLQLSNYKDALSSLQKISDQNLYFDQAQWYTALAYYHNNDLDKAKEIFIQMSNDENHYQATASKRMLESLE